MANKPALAEVSERTRAVGILEGTPEDFALDPNTGREATSRRGATGPQLSLLIGLCLALAAWLRLPPSPARASAPQIPPLSQATVTYSEQQVLAEAISESDLALGEIEPMLAGSPEPQRVRGSDCGAHGRCAPATRARSRGVAAHWACHHRTRLFSRFASGWAGLDPWRPTPVPLRDPPRRQNLIGDRVPSCHCHS
jgi:hypothetical protein